MKKFIAFALSLLMLINCAAAISHADNKKIQIVTTIFPIYDWVREIAGENPEVEITMLLDSGVDLHSYQPTAADIMKIASCDMFIYVGGESDEWVEDALKEAVNPNMVVVSLLEILGDDVKAEEIVEGMEHEHHHDEDEDDDHDHEEDHDHEDEDHDHDHDHDDEDHDHDHEEETDEHVWLSLRCAQKLVKALAEALIQADSNGADAYQTNAESYLSKLADLDARYAETVSKASYHTVLFGDRFPFRYLTDDYGLTYYAAFTGCSAESEASFETIVFLAQKMDELGLPAVLTIENPKTRIAETVVNTSAAKDQKILSLDSMQSVTAQDVQSGATYLSIMESNLKVLEEALN